MASVAFGCLVHLKFVLSTSTSPFSSSPWAMGETVIGCIAATAATLHGLMVIHLTSLTRVAAGAEVSLASIHPVSIFWGLYNHGIWPFLAEQLWDKTEKTSVIKLNKSCDFLACWSGTPVSNLRECMLPSAISYNSLHQLFTSLDPFRLDDTANEYWP